MKKLTLVGAFAFIFFSTNFAFAQTEVTENIESVTVWSLENSPYLVRNDLTVSSGATLTIEAGVVVKLADGISLIVDGQLNANGNSSDQAIITSIHDDSVGGDSNGNGSDSSPGEPINAPYGWGFARWNTIQFNAGSTGNLQHSQVRYGGGNMINDSRPSIQNIGGMLTINNSQLQNAKMLHIKQMSGELSLLNCSIFDGSGGIGIKGGVATIENNEIFNLDLGLIIDSSESVTFNNNNFYDSTNPLSLWLVQGTPLSHSGNVLQGNYYNGMVLRGPVMTDVELSGGDLVYIVSNVGGDNPLTRNLEVELTNDLSIDVDASLSFVDGAILKLDSYSRLLVEGTLNIEGDPGQPIIVTSLFDNQNGGAVWDEDNRDPNSNRWAIIDMTEGSVVTAQHGVFKYNAENRFYTGALFHNRGGNLAVSWSNMRDSLAIAHKAGQTTVHNSHFGANYTGIQNFTTDIIDATNNYWDHTTGPTHSSNPSGQGAYVSDYVTYSPWLSEPSNFEPAGAPSVLFLPGIMGSRLYEESEVCGENGEIELWISTSDCKQLRLLTNIVGDSINEIYTHPEESDVIDEIFIPNLYKSFLNDLSQWKDEGIIGDYRAVPYDWRLKLEDILKTKVVGGKVVYDSDTTYTESYIYQALAELATTTSSEVTIVAHSNGGLLTKTFLDVLEDNGDPLLERIKNVIFIGVPQTGTPEAVVGLLHGSPIGPLVSQSMSRRLMNSSPFAYHLLPSDQYFEGDNRPVVSFESGVVTDQFIERYGTEIRSKEDLEDFLLDSNRTKPEVNDLVNPEIVSSWLIDYANSAHSIQSNWTAPGDMQVQQIAGVGLYTPVRIEYFTHERCTERNPLKLFLCSERTPALGYRVIETRGGDRTVVTDSAVGMSGIDSKYLDLNLYDSVFKFGRVHRDILEVPDVRNFISNTLSGAIGNYDFLTTDMPLIDDSERFTTYLHSPLDLTLVLADGIVISSSTPLYQGVHYARYGEMQTISGPMEMLVGGELKLVGESAGSFTLDIERWEGEDLVQSSQFSAIPSSANSLVTIPLVEEIADIELMIDYEGDELVDVIFTLNESSELEYQEVVTINQSRSKSSSSYLRVRAGQHLLTDLEKEQQLRNLMLELIRLLNLLKLAYEK